jgi:hypothetical protein
MRSVSRAKRGMTGRGAIAALLVSAALPCATANAAGCHANGAFGGVRAFLPDCREYELVTPPYKDGSIPEELPSGLSTISTDGNHVLASDTGGFAGTENDELNGRQKGAVYELTRTAGGGWTTEAISPPAELAARSQFVAESSDFARSLWELGMQGEAGEEVSSTAGLATLALREKATNGTVTLTEVGPEDAPGAPAHSFTFEGASSDLSTIVFNNVGKKTHWPGDKTRAGSVSLYAYTGTNNREPILVGVKNEGPLVGAAERNEHAELLSECGTELGSGSGIEGNTRNAVSGDGSTIYFTALRESCEAPAVNELYARVDAERTVAISEPAMTSQRSEECTGICRQDELSEEGHGRSPATFLGASKDGRKVFLTTAQPLLDVDRDTGNDIYQAEVEGGAVTRLTMVSRGRSGGGPEVEDPTPGENADVFAVARVSDDGAHVYFIGSGVLTKAESGANETAQAGGYNLYDYDSVAGTTSLVAVLVSTQEAQALEEAVTAELEVPVLERQARCESLPGIGGSEEEVEECEAEVEQLREALPAEIAIALENAVNAGIGLLPNERLFATTADGRYLIFESARHLTGAEDTSTVKQLFEYDATTGALARVSIGENGYNNNGNTENAEYVPRIVVPNDAHGGEPTSTSSSLSVSEAGSVFFTSRDRLTPSAVEGHENVYEYEPRATGACGAQAPGCLGLISPGDEASPAEVRGKPRLLGADLSGGDVFFVSASSLLLRDDDSQLDWYDARVEGGFEEVSAGPGCSEATCQGPATVAPVMPAVGGSASQSGEAPLALVSNAPPSALTAPRPTTSAQRLAKALKACHRGPRKRRRACEARARRRFAKKPTARSGRRR